MLDANNINKNRYREEEEDRGSFLGSIGSFLWTAIKVAIVAILAIATFGAILKHNKPARNFLDDLTKDKDGKGGLGTKGAELFGKTTDNALGTIKENIKDTQDKLKETFNPKPESTNIIAKQFENKKLNAIKSLTTIGVVAGTTLAVAPKILHPIETTKQAASAISNTIDKASAKLTTAGKTPIASLSGLDSAKAKLLNLPGIKQAASGASALLNSSAITSASASLAPAAKAVVKFAGPISGVVTGAHSIANAKQLHKKGETAEAIMEGASGTAEGLGFMLLHPIAIMSGTIIKDFTYVANVIATGNKTGVTRSTAAAFIGETLGGDHAADKLANLAYGIKSEEDLAQEKAERIKLATGMEAKLPDDKLNILKKWKEHAKSLDINIEPLYMINHVKDKGWVMPPQAPNVSATTQKNTNQSIK